MIKINLNDKLSKIHKTQVDFEKEYIKKILSERLVSKYKKFRIINIEQFSMFEQYVENKINPKHTNVLNAITDSITKILAGILILSPDEIVSLSSNSFNQCIKCFFKNNFNYDSRSSKIAEHIKQLNFNTCFYCNRNWISNIGPKKTYTLDHFLNKSTHPMFSLSLYNLVPSCYICNSLIKLDKTIGTISPYHYDYDFHQKHKFCFDNNKPKMIDTGDQYSDYIKLFKFTEMYETHQDIVSTIKYKGTAYPSSVVKSFSGINLDQFYKDIFGKEMFEDELDKYPLTKLHQDAGMHFGIIDDNKKIKL